MDLEHLRFEVASMSDGVHAREVPVLLRAEERVLCTLIMQTGNLPLMPGIPDYGEVMHSA